jgi:TRAP-type mannitol/chloroaromatic compound transport system substrate-binding protein
MYQDVLQQELKYNVLSFPAIAENPDSLGWFTKPIKSLADFKGVKYRTSGMSADVFKELGVSVVTIAPGDIVPALERGVLDGAELSGPSSDFSVGFHSVAKYYIMRSVQQPSGFMEFLLNKKKWDELPADLKAIVNSCCQAQTLYSTLKQQNQNCEALQAIVSKHGVTVMEVPDEVNNEILKAFDRVAERMSKANPTFAKVLASQKAWAKRAVNYRLTAEPDYSRASKYYWEGSNPYKK